MQATIGDRLHVHGNSVGQPDKTGEIIEVKGTEGAPPYLVHFDDGHTGLVFPGPDAIVESARRKAGARPSQKGGTGQSKKAGASRPRKGGR
jgi:hypothetical protein